MEKTIPKLTIFRGVSGSGKSTEAERRKNDDTEVVSRDIIRMMLFDTEDFINESMVTQYEDRHIAELLRDGKNVIVDDTNVTWSYVRRLADIGKAEGAEIKVEVFDVPLDVALSRNAARAARGGRDVPQDVIEKQHKRLEANKHMELGS